MRKNFSKIIKQLRIENGYTQEKLATTIGKSLSLVKKWESGERNPNANNLTDLTKLFGVDFNCLYNTNPNNHLFRVPIYSGENANTFFENEQIIDTIAFPQSMIENGFEYFGIPIIDNSLISAGMKKDDIAIFKKCNLKNIKSGEIGIFIFKDSVCCRVLNKNRKGIKLTSNNTDYKTIDNNGIKVIGKLYLTISYKQTYINKGDIR